MPVEREIRYQALQLCVFIPQVTQFAQFIQPKPPILLLSQIEGRRTDSQLPAELRDGSACLHVAQCSQNLLFGMSFFRHL
jgi:hypothetical protein